MTIKKSLAMLLICIMTITSMGIMPVAAEGAQGSTEPTVTNWQKVLPVMKQGQYISERYFFEGTNLTPVSIGLYEKGGTRNLLSPDINQDQVFTPEKIVDTFSVVGEDLVASKQYEWRLSYAGDVTIAKDVTVSESVFGIGLVVPVGKTAFDIPVTRYKAADEALLIGRTVELYGDNQALKGSGLIVKKRGMLIVEMRMQSPTAVNEVFSYRLDQADNSVSYTYDQRWLTATSGMYGYVNPETLMATAADPQLTEYTFEVVGTGLPKNESELNGWTLDSYMPHQVYPITSQFVLNQNIRAEFPTEPGADGMEVLKIHAAKTVLNGGTKVSLFTHHQSFGYFTLPKAYATPVVNNYKSGLPPLKVSNQYPARIDFSGNNLSFITQISLRDKISGNIVFNSDIKTDNRFSINDGFISGEIKVTKDMYATNEYEWVLNTGVESIVLPVDCAPTVFGLWSSVPIGKTQFEVPVGLVQYSQNQFLNNKTVTIKKNDGSVAGTGVIHLKEDQYVAQVTLNEATSNGTTYVYELNEMGSSIAYKDVNKFLGPNPRIMNYPSRSAWETSLNGSSATFNFKLYGYNMEPITSFRAKSNFGDDIDLMPFVKAAEPSITMTHGSDEWSEFLDIQIKKSVLPPNKLWTFVFDGSSFGSFESKIEGTEVLLQDYPMTIPVIKVDDGAYNYAEFLGSGLKLVKSFGLYEVDGTENLMVLPSAIQTHTDNQVFTSFSVAQNLISTKQYEWRLATDQGVFKYPVAVKASVFGLYNQIPTGKTSFEMRLSQVNFSRNDVLVNKTVTIRDVLSNQKVGSGVIAINGGIYVCNVTMDQPVKQLSGLYYELDGLDSTVGYKSFNRKLMPSSQTTYSYVERATWSNSLVASAPEYVVVVSGQLLPKQLDNLSLANFKSKEGINIDLIAESKKPSPKVRIAFESSLYRDIITFSIAKELLPLNNNWNIELPTMTIGTLSNPAPKQMNLITNLSYGILKSGDLLKSSFFGTDMNSVSTVTLHDKETGAAVAGIKTKVVATNYNYADIEITYEPGTILDSAKVYQWKISNGIQILEADCYAAEALYHLRTSSIQPGRTSYLMEVFTAGNSNLLTGKRVTVYTKSNQVYGSGLIVNRYGKPMVEFTRTAPTELPASELNGYSIETNGASIACRSSNKAFNTAGMTFVSMDSGLLNASYAESSNTYDLSFYEYGMTSNLAGIESLKLIDEMTKNVVVDVKAALAQSNSGVTLGVTDLEFVSRLDLKVNKALLQDGKRYQLSIVRTGDAPSTVPLTSDVFRILNPLAFIIPEPVVVTKIPANPTLVIKGNSQMRVDGFTEFGLYELGTESDPTKDLMVADMGSLKSLGNGNFELQYQLMPTVVLNPSKSYVVKVTYLYNPMMVSLQVLAKPSLDYNKDGKITLSDLELLKQHYNSKPGDLNFNTMMDLNNDGVVDLYDLVILSKSL